MPHYYRRTVDFYFKPPIETYEDVIKASNIAWKNIDSIPDIFHFVIKKKDSRECIFQFAADCDITQDIVSISEIPLIETPNFVRYVLTVLKPEYPRFQSLDLEINIDIFTSMANDEFTKLNNACDEFGLEYLITNRYDIYSNFEANEGNVDLGFKNDNENEKKLVLKLFGLEDILHFIEPSIRALCDIYMQNTIRICELSDYYDNALIFGARQGDLQKLCEFYGVKIYSPILRSHLSKFSLKTSLSKKIFISSSEEKNCLLVEDLLNKEILKLNNTSKYLSTLQSTIGNMSNKKLFFIEDYYDEAIEKLMVEYGCFIDIYTPSNSVLFYSNNDKLLKLVSRVFANNILNKVSEFIFQYTGEVENFKLIDLLVKQNVDLNITFNSITNEYHLIGDIFDDCFQQFLVQPEFQNKELYKMRFLIELLPEFKDFITGKKFGKLNKTQEENNLSISLLIKNDVSNLYDSITKKDSLTTNVVECIFIEVFSEDNISNLIKGIELVEMELPFEKGLFIPESIHRAIIGNGGSLIQSIMKKYNVFIQFFNTYDYPQNEFSFIRYNNVMIRCPNKNKDTIDKVEQELYDLAKEFLRFNEKDEDTKTDIEEKDNGIDTNTEKNDWYLWELNVNELETMMMRNVHDKSTRIDGGKKIHHDIGELEEKYNIYIQFPEYGEYDFSKKYTCGLNSSNNKDLIVMIKGKGFTESYLKEVIFEKFMSEYVPKTLSKPIVDTDKIDDFLKKWKNPIFYEYNINVVFNSESQVLKLHYFDSCKSESDSSNPLSPLNDNLQVVYELLERESSITF